MRRYVPCGQRRAAPCGRRADHAPCGHTPCGTILRRAAPCAPCVTCGNAARRVAGARRVACRVACRVEFLFPLRCLARRPRLMPRQQAAQAQWSAVNSETPTAERRRSQRLPT
eukprot:gene8960-biopygen5115